MKQHIEGISGETVENVAVAIFSSQRRQLLNQDFLAPLDHGSTATDAITALLASGEVVLKNDVAEILDHVARAHTALHNCQKSEMLDYAHEEIHKVFEIEKRMK